MRFLFKIILSLCLATAILLALQWVVGFGLRHNSNFKPSYIQLHRIDAGVLAHGSCESEKMLDPSVIRKYIPLGIYNLALNHSDFADNYLLIQEYLKHQAKPKLVLLFAIPESFDSTITNVFNTYRFTHLMNDPVVKEVVKEVDQSYGKFSFLPFIRYSYYSNFTFYKALDGLLHYVRKDYSTRWPDGFDAPVFYYQRPSEKAKKEDRTPIFFHWSKLREKYFVKTIELLQKNGIKVVVYHSPIYYEALVLQNNRDYAINKIDSICRQHQVPHFTFDTLSMRFDRTNYYSSINPTIPTYNMTLQGNEAFNNFFGKFLQDTLPQILNESSNQKIKSDTSNKQE